MPVAGVPKSDPVFDSETPDGRAPVAAKVGAGAPVAVTLNEPAVPTVKVVAAALVIAGAVEIFNVSDGSGALELPDVPHVGSPGGGALSMLNSEEVDIPIT